MKGTLTFYLPLQRNATTPPEITLAVRRVARDRWQAGLAISGSEQFKKERGRVKAEGRLKGGQYITASPGELVTRLGHHLERLTLRRPGATGPNTLRDLRRLVPRLQGMRIE